MAAPIVFVIILAILAIVIYLVRKTKKDPNEIENMPHISGLPIVWGYLRYKSYDEIGDITYRISKGHDIYVTTIGPFKQVSVFNPDYARILLTESEDTAIKVGHTPETLLYRFFGDGLPFANGDRWKNYRKLATPAFNQALSPEMVGETVFELFSFMEKNFKLGQPVDMYELMRRLTIEVLGKLAFGYQFGCFDSEETPYLISLYKYVMSTIVAPYRIMLPWINRLPLEANRKFFSAMDEFDEFIYDLIRKKRKEIANQQDSNNNRVDLLTTMLKLSEQEGIDDNMKQQKNKELRDEMVNYFVAGHDTTLMALCTSFYYLAKHPEIRDKARAEVISVIGNEPVIPSSEQLKEMKYISAIIKESLRIHPPTPILTFRKLTKQVKVGPYVLPENTLFTVNGWQLHHDPKYWENPKQFNPERFLSNEKRNPGSWTPFSAGPRNCVGQNFSIMEQKVTLSMMLLKYNWTLPENSINKEKLLLAPHFLLKPFDFQLILTERDQEKNFV